MTKKISFAIGNVEDVITDINGTPIDCTAQQLVDDTESGYWFEANPNGQTDLCTEVADAENDWTGIFAEVNTTSIYTKVSNEFVGGRPTTRCPKCVF